jgi:hypothetical protein
VNLWMKRALGAAALGGGLLVLGAGVASAQEVSVDGSAQVGRSTSAEVRVCANGRVLSGLVGSCGDQAGSDGTSGSARAGRGNGARASAQAPSADVSVETRGNRRQAGTSGQATAAPRSRAATADAAADTSPRARVRVGAGADATDSGQPPAVDSPTTEPPASGVEVPGPIASGNQVSANAGEVSADAPVNVCGNSAGVLGDASASCGPDQQSSSNGTGTGATTVSAGTGDSSGDPTLGDLGSGNQVDATVGGVSASAPVTVCGNSAGVLGDAWASCSPGRSASSNGSIQPSGGAGGSAQAGEAEAGATVGGVSASAPVTACGNGIGLLGDASVSCGAAQDPGTGGGTGQDPGTGGGTGQDSGTGGGGGQDPGTGGITVPGLVIPGLAGPTGPPGGTDSPGTATNPGPTGTAGPGTPGQTGTVGIPGSSSGPGGLITALARLRPLVRGSGALAFTGAASDLLAVFAVGLLALGALFLRATRPAAVTEGGGS